MAEPWEVCVKCGGSSAPCECARPEVVEYVPRPDDGAGYHDRRLARRKRNPWFRFWFWLESRKLSR